MNDFNLFIYIYIIFNKSFDSILIVLNFLGSYLLVLLLKRIYWKQIKKSEFDFYL